MSDSPTLPNLSPAATIPPAAPATQTLSGVSTPPVSTVSPVPGNEIEEFANAIAGGFPSFALLGTAPASQLPNNPKPNAAPVVVGADSGNAVPGDPALNAQGGAVNPALAIINVLTQPQNEQVLVGLVGSALKPGHKTTEFWLTAFCAVAPIGLECLGALHGTTPVIVSAAIALVYQFSRGALKEGTANRAGNNLTQLLDLAHSVVDDLHAAKANQPPVIPAPVATPATGK